ncbi:hypothetical protein A1O7_07613 [Cladophialophora yegresii CBS 114405]|uniref:Exonuclease V n=1 Tax=Cladophialophora yegresii CBS 114405 TaxID=1182544 RepID=W9VYD8_9EURO|nr:uncharacterized protein A1O7_07613 [Cladophialophora yegresii CBS 114405]EXJ57266.1 hypothetical protein A1O7_07613 [Cladophialophora yegresii CBS 114405]
MSTPDTTLDMQLESDYHKETTDVLEDEDLDAYSDFADDPETLEIIDQLLLEAANQRREDALADAPLVVTDIEDYEDPRGVYLPKVRGVETTRQWGLPSQSVGTQQQQQNIRDESAERRRSQGDKEVAKALKDDEAAPPNDDGQDAALQPTGPDTRTPLERFRKPPKKALSVTDLISPSWCELQYYYILTKHGRKRRTPAMKQGSAVHQALEDEVHTTVPVEITKKEDSWGLRIWNIIQGLRTLRETGKTRELEIWGSVGGELVNGVIDELSYECPDPKLEEMSQNLQKKKDTEPPLPEYQASIRDYLVTSENRAQGQSLQQALGDDGGGGDKSSQPDSSKPGGDDRKIYITDVKTRQTPTLPTGSAMRPTLVQLHLYHHMLENLAQGKFMLSQLAERYAFDVNETFSDSFIAQIGGLNQELVAMSQQSDDMRHDNLTPSSTQDSLDILLQHNTLTALWGFMLEQLRQTFLLASVSSASSSSHPNATSTTTQPNTDTATAGPDFQDPTIPPPSSLSQLPDPPSQPTRLSPILTARYIATNYNHSNDETRVLGSKSLLFNPSFLTSQLYASLGFWKGDREPRGVEVNDAWKCRICEFRDECAWVKERDEVMVREARERRKVKEELEKGEDGKADKGRRSRV